MRQELDQARRQLEAWLEQAVARGWLAVADKERLASLESAEASNLFSSGQPRPLLVGFFGGTGVGKSSLLNRLAGETIARVGVERPTSREVTLYLHADHQIQDLPDEFPLDSTQVVRHHRPGRRDVAWIDMPDMDSVESANRQLVLKWLPYIDWVVYVVSPERYRDDVGWRTLRERAQRHHWLFVMNQADLGLPAQRDQFARDLSQAGIRDPQVLLTSCTGDEKDEFDRLEGVIREAIEDHGLQELQRLGLLARWRDLSQLARDVRRQLGEPELLDRFVEAHIARARVAFEDIHAQLMSPVSLLAQRFPGSRWWWRTANTTGPNDDEIERATWNEPAEEALQDIVVMAQVQARELELPPAPAARLIQARLEHGAQTVRNSAVSALRGALAGAGTSWRRGLQGVSRMLYMLLPLAAAGWALYHALTRYWQGLDGEAEFLSVDFASHSLLLIFLGWLVPFLVYCLLRGSPQQNAKRGLDDGIRAGLRRLEAALDQAYQDIRAEHRDMLAALDGLSIEVPVGDVGSVLEKPLPADRER